MRLQFCVCHGGFDLLIDLRTMVTTLTMVSLLTVVAFRRLSVLDVSFGHQRSMQRKSNTESEWMPHPLLAILGTKGCHATPCWPHKTGLAHWCTDGEWMHIVSILPSGPGYHHPSSISNRQGAAAAAPMLWLVMLVLGHVESPGTASVCTSSHGWNSWLYH